MQIRRRHRRPQSGQAMVEAVLTLPLIIFLILGTLQLFLMLQARILAQYAAYRAVRAGSLNRGACVPMMHSAIVNVLPTLERTDTPERLAAAFGRHRDNTHSFNGFNGPFVEIVRVRPTVAQANAFPGGEDGNFDRPSGSPTTLELRMIYWYYMKIPFANWVMSRMFQAHYGLRTYSGFNPLNPATPANWASDGATFSGGWPSGPLGPSMRSWADSGHYVFPIEDNAAMRMMTPALSAHFSQAACRLNGTGP